MRRSRVGWGAWLLAAACLYFFENNAGTRALLAASVLLPALSVGCAAVSARRVRCGLDLPDGIAKGDTARAVCRLTGSRLLPGCVLDGALAVENPLTGERWEEPLAASGDGAAADIAAARCGRLRVRTAAAVRDWFGLARFPIRPAEATALVLPRLDPADAQDTDADGPGGGAGQGLGAEPEGDLRDYVPGDPVRLIHWKLSAKLDSLLVREAAGSAGRGLFLMWETVRSGASPEAMDGAAEAFLSASQALAARGAAHSTCWFDHERGELNWVEVNGPADFDRMMARALCAASAEEGEGVARRFEALYPYVRPDRALLFSPADWMDDSEEERA